NPDYANIILTNPQGEVLAANHPFSATNLGDRKHVREAIERKEFAVGEYIVTRVGNTIPAFPFAYPVLDKNGNTIAVLTATFKLARLSRLHETLHLPGKSFVAVTDHQGIRLFYNPPNKETNPIGMPIRPEVWERTGKTPEPGVFLDAGSDGVRRIFAFEKIRLAPGASPYLYVWAAIPESHILQSANAVLTRNLLLMLLAALLSLFLAWLIGKHTFISPIQSLVTMTRNFAAGELQPHKHRGDVVPPNELGTLTKTFYEMADALTMSQRVLRENEARFRLLMDSMDALIYVADMQTHEILFINEYGRKKFGDITGTKCWQSLQKGQSGACSFCTNKYLLDEEGRPGEIHTSEAQNTVTGIWYQAYDRAITWVDDRLVRFQFATDISTRKRAEKRLAEETEQLAVTLRSIAEGVITTDSRGGIILINKVAETLTGWNLDEAAGQPLTTVFNIIHSVTKTAAKNPLQEVMASGEIIALGGQTALISKNGRARTIAASGAPTRDHDGKIIGMVLVFRDITAQLRTEEELLKIKKLEAIGVLAGGIAHDFNNILAAIVGNIDLSLLEAGLPAKTEARLHKAVKATYQARALTQQLLTFAKGGEPIKKTASLLDVIKDTAHAFLQNEDTVSCRYLFPDDLWLVDIDQGQLSQVVRTLLRNACDAMPSGGVIEIRCENITASAATLALPQDGDYVQMSIKDSGTGIAANILDKIFDPYFSTKQQGSGLGLAISHSIISKHGGHISVHSTSEKGSTFMVYLPASAQNLVAAKEKKEAGVPTGKARILVMDDEEPVRQITQAMLGYLGHDVLLAQNGEEAIKIYAEARSSTAPVDIIIMDLTIPGGMGGKEAVQKILTMDPEAKVIVSSGYSNDPVMANFKKYGFCATLAKPYQLRDLTEAISQFLG
ncbi:MAG: ATP-binding protein, partial [Deltaproteobacteria bacterium]|nr:ATP-binding protein [Deltaproteobacteria bacterium]